MCVCVCAYTHTHTHTAQMGYLDVSPGVGIRHLQGPKNPDGLNLGIHIFVYVYKVHMCIYMLRCENKRLHLESSKQNYYIISLRAIIQAIFT